MKAKLWENEEIGEVRGFICSDCGKGLLMEDIGKQWDRCEFCGDSICTTCTHYLGTMTRGLWKDYINVRRVCRKCVIQFRPF